MGPSGSGRSIDAIGTHLNPEGIFVQLSDPPPAGTQVTVTLAGMSHRGISASGEVIHAITDQETRLESGIGIHLHDNGPAWRKLYALLADSGLDGLS